MCFGKLKIPVDRIGLLDFSCLLAGVYGSTYHIDVFLYFVLPLRGRFDTLPPSSSLSVHKRSPRPYEITTSLFSRDAVIQD